MGLAEFLMTCLQTVFNFLINFLSTELITFVPFCVSLWPCFMQVPPLRILLHQVAGSNKHQSINAAFIMSVCKTPQAEEGKPENGDVDLLTKLN